MSIGFSAHTVSLPPCTLVRHPFSDDVIVYATYQLESDRTRRGSIVVCTISNNFTQLATAPTDSAILDIKFQPEPEYQFFTAHSTGCIDIWSINVYKAEEGDDDSRLKVEIQKLHSISVAPSPEILVLSLNFSPSCLNLLTFTLSSGQVGTLDVGSISSVTTPYLHDVHMGEAWISQFHGTNNQILFSGGDDSVLSTIDLREDPIQIYKNKNIHNAGVTYILPWWPYQKVTGNENHIYTGSYDDTMRLLDWRMMAPRFSTLSEKNLQGGVWRLIPHNTNPNQILACCMYAGAKILDVSQSSEISIVKSFTEGHNSMVYGGDWVQGNTVVTCSFYDKQLCIWNA